LPLQPAPPLRSEAPTQALGLRRPPEPAPAKEQVPIPDAAPPAKRFRSSKPLQPPKEPTSSQAPWNKRVMELIRGLVSSRKR
ncbi:hypothetical protein D7W81_27645, partial [Corallococcus aberystwythensis]